jgi:hypothetical protein
MSCPCIPCPWCTLGLDHWRTVAHASIKVRELMMEWSSTGCSVFQVALVVFSYEWILRHHDQRPYSPQLTMSEIAVVPVNSVDSLSTHYRNIADGTGMWSHAPPPPPPGLQRGSSSSSSAAPAVPSAAETWLALTPRGSVGRQLSCVDNVYDTDLEVPEVYPHFQWQAGTSKKVWRSFEEPWQTRLRDAYTADQVNFTIKWEDDEIPDTIINFLTWTQQNEQTSFVRRIRIKP